MVNVKTVKTKKVMGITFELTIDAQGKKTVAVIVPWGKRFEIAGENLPETSKYNSPVYAEIKAYILKNGTNYQKNCF